MDSNGEARYAIILPFQRDRINRIFQGQDVICKFIGRRTVKIGKGSKVLFYVSGAGREVVGEGQIESMEYTDSESAIRKHGKRLFLSKTELQAYKGNRNPQSRLLVLELKNVVRYEVPNKLANPLTMAGQTLSKEAYAKIRNSNPLSEDWAFKGLGKVRTEDCGCEVRAYPFGKMVYSGCAKHHPHNRYICQVCFKEFTTEKKLQSHRWEHSV